MIVRISEKLEQEWLSAAIARLPLECCGVVYGKETEGFLDVESFGIIRNAATSPENRFAFHPEDWVAVFSEAQQNQRDIVGFFHSHPEGPLLPSKQDDDGSLPWRTYWIVGISSVDRAISAFRRHPTDGRWLPQRIERV
ncbi:Mov34/MPN/PAD-1 family protein [Cohnella soli]|uniref:Mov34/MPN/PAD-1 family protein n=1 Tax=Cohnella soli TaxID=425005 RepID=A0ABW0HZH7_9BACL